MTPRGWDAFLTAADRLHEPPSGRAGAAALGRRVVAVHLDESGPPVPADVRERIGRLLDSLRARSVPVHEVAAAPHELGAASALFGTPLLSQLVRDGAETLLLFGGTASGRVRATAVDAASSGFAVVVVEDCVWDPIEASRAIALYDVQRLYGSVVTAADLDPATAASAAHAGHGHAHGAGDGHEHGAGHGHGRTDRTAHLR
jgi:hypothetical protein